MEEYQKQSPGMPFYRTYPMQDVYETERLYGKDMQRLRELYPGRMKKLLVYVEEECDKMEYEGSMMYDEYPDAVAVSHVSAKIYDRMFPVKQADKACCTRNRDFLDMIQVILCDEMYRRRGRKRRCHRQWWSV